MESFRAAGLSSNEANTAKRYVRVKWIHSEPYEPVVFYYEIGKDRWASRGLEVFADGSVAHVEHGVKEAPIPEIHEINLDPQFQGVEITQQEFEAVWRKLKM